MKKFLCAVAVVGCAVFATSTLAVELFPNNKADQITPNNMLPSGSTMGGYAIYEGDESWRLMQLSTQETGTLGDAVAVTLGSAWLNQYSQLGSWAASMYVTTNLTGAGLNQFMTGNPCSGSHLIRVEKSLRQDDNCLTVDAQRSNGTPQSTMLLLRISHAKSAGRIYHIALFISLEQLGFLGTSLSDWTPAAVQANPERAAFVQRLQKWGESLQAASERALDFKKPQDAFAGIPAIRTLAPPLVEGHFPAEFLAAVAETRSRPGFRAFAYTQAGRQFRWQTRNGMGDQTSADEQALESCESGRPASAPPCKLFDLSAAPQ